MSWFHIGAICSLLTFLTSAHYRHSWIHTSRAFMISNIASWSNASYGDYCMWNSRGQFLFINPYNILILVSQTACGEWWRVRMFLLFNTFQCLWNEIVLLLLFDSCCCVCVHACVHTCEHVFVLLFFWFRVR